MRRAILRLLPIFLSFAVHAQTTPQTPAADPTPAANPARPTASVPAVLPPTGYLQLEQGINRGVTSPSGTTAQTALNQATKIALTSRFLVQVLSQPFTYNTVFTPGGQPPTVKTVNSGDIDLGTQIVLLKSTGPRPTIDIGYNGRVRTGTAANLDSGDFQQSLILFFSGDLPHGTHYDSIYQFNEQRQIDNQSTVTVANGTTIGTSPTHLVRRAQYVQTLSVTHPIFPKSTAGRLAFDVELQHYTQPFVTGTSHNRPIAVRANAVDLLISTPFALRPNLVLDAAILRGLTSTSTQWQGTAGVTWLVPHRLWKAR
jgi:hypothetical protein